MKSERMCVSCRQMLPKDELVRVVRYRDEIVIDDTGKGDGRGAYVCKNPDCIKKAIKTKAFNKSFKSAVSSDVYQMLEERFVK